MNKKIYIFIMILIFIIGCSSGSGGENDAEITSILYGTITVPESSYWDYIKLGLFSGGIAGDCTYIEEEDNSTTEYRLIYENNDNGDDFPLSSLAFTYSIDTSGDTERGYSIELPDDNKPIEDEDYYFVAWYDGNDNDILDLKDAGWLNPETIELGEYNRFSKKATTNLDDEPTTITVVGFRVSPIEGIPESDGFKYFGYDSEFYNESDTLSTDNNTGFDFEITANSGW